MQKPPPIHEMIILKTVHPYFQALWDMVKCFEVRFNDRNFRVGQWLALVEYLPAPDGKLYPGSRIVVAQISYILDSPDYCKAGYIVLQLTNMHQVPFATQDLIIKGVLK